MWYNKLEVIFMTLWDAWQEGGVSVPWSRLAKSKRKKLFATKKKFADYYLIGGRVPNKGAGDNEKLIILEVADGNKARLLLDNPGVPGNKFD